MERMYHTPSQSRCWLPRTPTACAAVSQVIAFLAGLHHSGLFRPTLIVCPATVLRQWLRELRCWYPPFRAVLFHDSGRSPFGSARPKGRALVDVAVNAASGVLLTTYEQLRLRREELLPVRWGAVVLDEGHKIRNPDSEITLVCKQVGGCGSWQLGSAMWFCLWFCLWFCYNTGQSLIML